MGFLLGLIVGLAVGAAVTALLLRRPASVAAPVSLPPVVAEPSSIPPQRHASAASEEEPPDQDLKPVLDATRGVLTELEQRYQGARRPEKPKQPRVGP